jgi:hypothetical protein
VFRAAHASSCRPTSVIVHSTGDGSLPGPWQTMAWPIVGGRDLSRYGNWSAYLGFFVPNVNSGFAGLYDEEADQGIVRAFAPGWPAGTKLFGPATLSPSLWTDDGSTYIELWSGATTTFAKEATLQPGATVAWQERWYPVHGIGTLRAANAAAALNLIGGRRGHRCGAAVSTPTIGRLTLYVGGAEAAAWDLTLLPGQAFRNSGDKATGELGAAPRGESGSDPQLKQPRRRGLISMGVTP